MAEPLIRVYLAGPIESAGGNMNWPLFRHVAERLRSTGKCAVFSPTEYAEKIIGPLDVIRSMPKKDLVTARRYLLKDEINWIIDNADYVLMLPGWQQADGAVAERAVAIALNIPVRDVPNVILLDIPMNAWDIEDLKKIEDQR